MKASFDIVLAGLCLAGLAATGAALFVCLAWRAVARRVRGADGVSGSRRVAFLAAPLAFAVVMVLYGGSKGFLPDGMRASDTSAVSETTAASGMMPSSAVQSDGAALSADASSVLVSSPAAATEATTEAASGPFAGEPSLVGKWWRRGAYEDGEIVELTESAGWAFPWRGGRLTRFEVWANGAVYASEKDEESIARLKTPLSLKPMSSRVVHGFATNNAYRVEWRDAHPNRDPEAVADAAIELRPNGDVVLAEGGAETLLPYEIPFAHDGFGQDEEWVLANFANADEILAIGYRAWVDAQVGEGERNGLYSLSASFPAAPPYAVELVVGGLSVCVTNAGEYVFLLEKGVEYSLSSEPFDAEVAWSADDGAEKSPRVAAATSATGRWTEDLGRLFIVPQKSSGTGTVLWLPGLKGSPDAGHVGAFPGRLRFTAGFVDCCADPAATYRWRTDDPDVRILSPGGRTTEVEFASMPSWRRSEISVTATIGTNSLVSTLRFPYGTNATPQARLSLALPQGLVRRDLWMAGSRPAPLAVRLGADCPTGGTVRVWQTSGEGLVELSRPLPAEFAVEDAAEWSETVFVTGVAASAAAGDVGFACSFAPPGATGAVLRASASCTVYAPGAVAVPEAPETGLAVVRGASVGVRLGMDPSAGRGASVEWRTAKRKTRDGYGPWRLRASRGAEASLSMDEAGVFALRARTVCATQSNEVEYVHADGGERNHVGVSTTSGMLALRNAALAQMGSSQYGRGVLLPSRNGFAAVRKGSWKCNAFVADMAISVGLPVPVQHTTSRFWWPDRHYPPVANEWASSDVKIEGWTCREDYPVPGFIVAHPNPGGMGHVGIVDYDGEGIGAGSIYVTLDYDGFLDGTCGYREYTGGGQDEDE